MAISFPPLRYPKDFFSSESVVRIAAQATMTSPYHVGTARAKKKFFIVTATFLATMSIMHSADYYHLQAEKPFLILIQAAFTYAALRCVPVAGTFALFYVIGAEIMNDVPAMPARESDVLSATKEALQTLASGHNPYAHVFAMTRPAHSPFPYLPGELLFYGIPFSLHASIEMFEKYVGIAILFLFAALSPIVGTARLTFCLAWYVVLGVGYNTPICGANDAGLAFVLLCSVLSLAWSEYEEQRERLRASQAGFYASAIFMAWALLFKATAWPFFPFIGIYLWQRNPRTARAYLAVTLGICLLAILPFLISAPIGLITNVYMGFVFHNDRIWGLNLWSVLRGMGLPMDAHKSTIKIVDNLMVIAVAIACFSKPSISLSGALARGLVVLTTALFLSQYAPAPYWAFAITISAWALMLR
jgi:hypothetical protein